MSAQIVFLSLFLGIVSGSQPIALQVSGPVKSVRLMLGDRQVATLTKAPWRTRIDLGLDLTPRELIAVGLDADGKEIARAKQILNLPRPIAEFDIALEYAGGQVPVAFSLPWRHRMGIKPDSIRVTLDGAPLSLDRRLHAALPKLDLEIPHVIEAEMRFDDGFRTRREVVIESIRSDSGGTQLTPIMVRETKAQHPASWEGCIVQPTGKAVRTSAVENPVGVVIVVRDPLPGSDFTVPRRELESLSLAPGTIQRMIWPVGQHFDNGDSGAFLFVVSNDISAERTPFPSFLRGHGPVTTDNESRYFADAVAVAGIRAATGGQRRVVILVLNDKKDASSNDPRAVRRYLASIGVPFFVWSPAEIPPLSAAAWGEVDDVSTVEKLAKAVQRVRQSLEEQRIAWVNVDPLAALQLKAKESCGIEAAARMTAP